MKPLLTLTVVLPIVHGVGLGASFVLPIAAPAMIEETGLSPAFVGVYSGLGFVFGSLSAFFSGGFIRRFGGWRIGQVSLLATCLGLLVAIGEAIPFLIVSGILVGGAYSVLSPAGSHVMARYVTPRQAPLYFSLKQTGVPLAGILAGALVPFIVQSFGWQYAFLAFASAAGLLGLGIHRFRAEFDRDRDGSHSLSPTGAFDRLKVVLATPAYRQISMVAFCFIGLQATFSSFFVVYVVSSSSLDHIAAGQIFAMAQALAILARIGWGWVGGRFLAARTVIGMLGIGMAVAAILMTQFSVEWPAMGIWAVAALMSATALGWQGLIFAEIARQVPLAEVGPYTGGIMSIGSLNAALSPLAMSGLLALTGSYVWGFAGLGLLTGIAGIAFLRSPPQAPVPPHARSLSMGTRS